MHRQTDHKALFLPANRGLRPKRVYEPDLSRQTAALLMLIEEPAGDSPNGDDQEDDDQE